MCPLCIGTTVLLLSGTGSAGGVTALALRTIRRHKARLAPAPHRLSFGTPAGAGKRGVPRPS